MAVPATLLQLKTYDDLQALPDDGNRYELIFGEIVMSPSPRAKHQQTIADLAIAMRMHARNRQLGDVYFAPYDVRLSPYSIVQPDILFVSLANVRRLKETFVDGPPDLVVEVLSPASRSVDLIRKAALYANHGVPEYWVVDVDAETVTVNELINTQYVTVKSEDGIARSRVLVGFEIAPVEVFREPDWLSAAKSETE